MLEALVSSKIRRALFEYILAHPTEPFYLRGLAKALSLSVSPLRRELKRLEQASLLSSFQEANALFYRVNLNSPIFLELQTVGIRVTVPTPPGSPLALTEASTPVAPPVSPTSQLVQNRIGFWTSPFHGTSLFAAAGVGVLLLMILGSLLYLTVTNHRLLSVTQRRLTSPQTEITVVAPSATPASGAMQGARWRLVPGSIGGGFSSAAGASSKETY